MQFHFINWQLILSVKVILFISSFSNQSIAQENELKNLRAKLQKMTEFANQQKKLADIRQHALLLQRADEFWTQGNIIAARQRLESTLKRLRGFEYGHLQSKFEGDHQQLNAGKFVGSKSIAVSQDGKYIVTTGVSFDKKIRVWDGKTCKLLKTLQGNGNFIEDVAIASNGDFFASCGIRGKIIIWDMKTWRPRKTIDAHFNNQVLSIDICPDDERLVSTGKSGKVRVWRISDGKQLLEFDKHDGAYLRCCAFSPDGKLVATGGRKILIWDSRSGKIRQEIEPSPAGIFTQSVAFSPDGKRIACGLWDARQQAQLWDIETGKKVCSFPSAKKRVNGVCFSPNGKQVAIACEDYLVHLCDAQSGKLIKAFKGHNHFVYDVKFSPRGDKIMSAGRFSTVVFKINAKPWPLSLRSTTVTSFSADAKWICKSNRTGVQLVELASGEETRSFACTNLISYALSPDNKILATSSSDRTITIWDIRSSKKIRSLKSPLQPARHLIFSPEGLQLVSIANQNMLVAWDVKTGKKKYFKRCEKKILSDKSFGFSPDNTKAFYSVGNEVSIIDAMTGKQIMQLEKPPTRSPSAPTMSFSPDGTMIMAGFMHPWGPGEAAVVWDLNTGKRKFIVKGSTGSYGGHPKWGPAGQEIMVKIQDRKLGQVIQVWNVSSQRLVATLDSLDSISDLAFFPNGKRAAVAGRDSIRIFDLPTGELIYSLSHPGIKSLDVSSDGNYIQSRSGSSKSQSINVWRQRQAQQF